MCKVRNSAICGTTCTVFQSQGFGREKVDSKDIAWTLHM